MSLLARRLAAVFAICALPQARHYVGPGEPLLSVLVLLQAATASGDDVDRSANVAEKVSRETQTTFEVVRSFSNASVAGGGKTGGRHQMTVMLTERCTLPDGIGVIIDTVSARRGCVTCTWEAAHSLLPSESHINWAARIYREGVCVGRRGRVVAARSDAWNRALLASDFHSTFASQPPVLIRPRICKRFCTSKTSFGQRVDSTPNCAGRCVGCSALSWSCQLSAIARSMLTNRRPRHIPSRLRWQVCFGRATIRWPCSRHHARPR